MRFIKRMADRTSRNARGGSDASDGGADLHLHTRFSDGTDTPERVVELVRQAGLSAMAITDHDNVEAVAVAAPVARRQGIELIPGIEMSASADGLEVHLLGFFLDVKSAILQRHLAEQQARRVERVREMVRRLQRLGVSITAEEVFEVAGEGTVGRPHVARVLLKHGYIASLPEAFSRYLGPDNPGFVPGSPLSPAQVIRVIRAAGGVPVLAHPVYLKRDELIEGFVSDGLAGLEVYHSGHAPDLVRHYEQLADRLRMLRTGGSDYHGVSREGSPIGVVRLPYPFVEALKQWKATAHR
ncbi:MAG: PHP domain-containing protein [Candidatus Omnitrophica bacterium]|nr:PHP domain-containing protein [Candidatus Omnitrophota bacterium]